MNNIKKISIIILLAFSSSAFAQTWAELDSSTNTLNAGDDILSICTDKAGNVYAAGKFTNSNGKQYVAKWSGTSWAELGSGSNALNANNFIYTLCTDKAGNVYAAGSFKNSNGYCYVAQWNGTKWSEWGSSSPLNANNIIYSICTDTSGNVYAAGLFKNSNGYCYVAEWIHNSWYELVGGNGSIKIGSGSILSLCSDVSGNVYAGGTLLSPSTGYMVGKWDGTQWTNFGSNSGGVNNGQTNALCSNSSGNIYAGGKFKNSNYYHYVAKCTSSKCTELGSGSNTLNANDVILSICSDVSGNVYAAGAFTTFGKQYVAKWNGTTWGELTNGSSYLNANNYINSICTDAVGNVYAAGKFTNSSGNNYVAKYNCVTLNNFNIAACKNYSFKGNNITASGVYSDTITTTQGCDSIVIINLTIKNPITNNLNSIACNNYTFKGNTITSSGVYYDTLTAANGCDSIVILNLTINKSTSSTFTQTACYTYTFNGKTYTNSGVYMNVLTNAANCDSLVTLNLTINSANTSVKQINNVLTANATSSAYQWLDCKAGYSAISGATNQTFTATINGDYAVAVTQNTCSDTSACYTVSNLGICDGSALGGISVYPNPSTSSFSIQYSTQQKVGLTISNLMGEAIYQDNWLPAQMQKSIDVSSFSKGMYLIRLGTETKKIIVE